MGANLDFWQREAIFLKPRRATPYSAWLEHIPFGFYLVDLLRPGVIVELGTHWGDSYCAFCQAVDYLGIPTACYAIDTWQGDEHTGSYGEEVMNDLRNHHDGLYGSFSRLVQSRFDDALAQFGDETIDLLHIDGLHTQDAVTHDFEAWLPKLSKRGVVLFHDINVRENAFWVWKLWEDLETRYPAFAFRHGHGLGVLGVGSQLDPEVSELLNTPAEDRVQIRRFFALLGEAVSTRVHAEAEVGKSHTDLVSTYQRVADLKAENTQLKEHVDNLEAERTRLKGHIDNLEGQRTRIKEHVDNLEAERDQLGERVDRIAGELSRLRGYASDLESQVNDLQRGQIRRWAAEHPWMDRIRLILPWRWNLLSRAMRDRW